MDRAQHSVAEMDRTSALLEDPGRLVLERTASLVRSVEVAPCQLSHNHQGLWVLPCTQTQGSVRLPCQPGMGSSPVSSSCRRRPGSPPTAYRSLKIPPTKNAGHGVGKAVCRALRPLCLWALLLSEKKSHVGGLTHFPGWPRCPCGEMEREGHKQGSEPSRPFAFP